MKHPEEGKASDINRGIVTCRTENLGICIERSLHNSLDVRLDTLRKHTSQKKLHHKQRCRKNSCNDLCLEFHSALNFRVEGIERRL